MFHSDVPDRMSSDRKPCAVAVAAGGLRGPDLIRAFTATPGCAVRYACDIDKKRLAHIHALHPGIVFVEEFARLLEDDTLDAVALAAPAGLHRELAGRSLMAGKHVFVNEPMASSSGECRKLVVLASERRLILMVADTAVHSAPARRIKKIVDSGEIGEVLQVWARRLFLGPLLSDVGAIRDLAPRDVSVVLHLLPDPPVAVKCRGKAIVSENTEDMAEISLEFPSGISASVRVSRLDPGSVRDMIVAGSRKTIVFDDKEPRDKIRVFERRLALPPRVDPFTELRMAFRFGDVAVPGIRPVDPLEAACRGFVAALREGRAPETGGMHGLRVVEVIEAAERSLASGGKRVALGFSDRTACA
jgi:predicted dehydrogenase